MINREKVIKGLECCTRGNTCISDCPYYKEVPMTDGRCITAVQADALAMLKEQEAKTGHWTTKRNNLHDGEWYCDQCDYEPTVFEGMPYCASCGAKMEMRKW